MVRPRESGQVIELALPAIANRQQLRNLPTNTVFISVDTSALIGYPKYGGRTKVAGIAVLPPLWYRPWEVYGQQTPESFIEAQDVKLYELRGTRPSRPKHIGEYSLHQSATFQDVWRHMIQKIRRESPHGCKIAYVGQICRDFRRMALTATDAAYLDYNIPIANVRLPGPPLLKESFVEFVGGSNGESRPQSPNYDSLRHHEKAVWTLAALHGAFGEIHQMNSQDGDQRADTAVMSIERTDGAR
ncbi:hypothetical protein F5B19DRAFT_457912 [Rostrohypoxylon terebratum]|nr:hypothetical protein F5B19DRAFT_457912 [Rostrohypoxylon terebratum]